MTWVERAQPIKDKLDALDAAGGIRTERGQSDKVGSDWISYYVNDILVKREYIAQENPVGTANNPFVYAADMLLIPNAFYISGGVRKAWTGVYGLTAAWDDERFVVF